MKSDRKIPFYCRDKFRAIKTKTNSSHTLFRTAVAIFVLACVVICWAWVAQMGTRLRTTYRLVLLLNHCQFVAIHRWHLFAPVFHQIFEILPTFLAISSLLHSQSVQVCFCFDQQLTIQWEPGTTLKDEASDERSFEFVCVNGVRINPMNEWTYLPIHINGTLQCVKVCGCTLEEP